MSTNILEPGQAGHDQVIVTRFAGGVQRGVCYQLNGPQENGKSGYVQCRQTEAVQVAIAILKDAVPSARILME